ncbi:MAG: hypothetical protein U0804_04500 [Gemmataceae bacterium]
MPTRRAALVALVATPLAAAQEPPALTLSTFSAEVTIPVGHPCMGGGVAPVKEVLDPLEARGFVLRGAGRPVVFLAVDWCEVRNTAYDRFRQKIAAAVGTDPVRVMLCALHQHDAPIFDTAAEELLEKHKANASVGSVAVFERLTSAVADAAAACLKTARRVTHLGTGRARVEQVASNRRYVDEGGAVRYNRMSATRDPKVRAAGEGTIDPELKLLSFWDGDTALAGLSAYAVHPMSFYGRGGVSADFVGLARRRLQADTPAALQLYASGCSGNVTAGKFNDGDPGNRPVLADRMYRAMAAAWRDTRKTPVTTPTFRSVPLTLESRGGDEFTIEALTRRLTSDARPFGRCLAALGLSWANRVRAGIPVDVPVLDFGGAALTVLPAESYVEFQLAAQRARPADFVVVAGYGECGPGYIPVERAWAENDGNLSDWCWVARGCEARMTDAIRRALAR